LRRGIVAEADAITLYSQQADNTGSEPLRKLLLKIAKEEKEHLAEFVQMLKMIDPEQAAEFEKPLEHMLSG